MSVIQGTKCALRLTTFSCEVACSFSAFARSSLYFCSSGFSGLGFCDFWEGSAPASIVDIVAAERVAMSAMMAVCGVSNERSKVEDYCIESEKLSGVVTQGVFSFRHTLWVF